eukprot:comp22462_c0_seq1/m.55368 comp22462_c0_seq1/g.55368  ORF comp22462_c0_seq1/g.55368 comp22462_c0_seq1/m.55368 type:complete len:369 (-) comp22462_c0_seq1:130-1236(-)
MLQIWVVQSREMRNPRSSDGGKEKIKRKRKGKSSRVQLFFNLDRGDNTGRRGGSGSSHWRSRRGHRGSGSGRATSTAIWGRSGGKETGEETGDVCDPVAFWRRRRCGLDNDFLEMLDLGLGLRHWRRRGHHGALLSTLGSRLFLGVLALAHAAADHDDDDDETTASGGAGDHGDEPGRLALLLRGCRCGRCSRGHGLRDALDHGILGEMESGAREEVGGSLGQRARGLPDSRGLGSVDVSELVLSIVAVDGWRDHELQGARGCGKVGCLGECDVDNLGADAVWDVGPAVALRDRRVGDWDLGHIDGLTCGEELWRESDCEHRDAAGSGGDLLRLQGRVDGQCHDRRDGRDVVDGCEHGHCGCGDRGRG